MKLEQLIDQFMECIQEPPASPERARRSKAFNKAFASYADDNPMESMRTFARRLELLGVPYTRAFTDVVQVRGLGA